MNVLIRQFAAQFESFWRTSPNAFIIVLPLAWLYQFILALRAKLYRSGIYRMSTTTTPVIVIGNLVVGGSGKTPTLIALAKWFTTNGYRVGVISRGYGRRSGVLQLIDAQSSVENAGDEGLLIAKKTACPVVVGADRAQAAHKLLGHFDLDIILSDDGLTHYRLDRKLNILCRHDIKHHKNYFTLPAGPYRERRCRSSAPLVEWDVGRMLKPALGLPYDHLTACTVHWSSLKDTKLMVVAGIAKPERFYQMLREKSLEFEVYPLIDHGVLTLKELAYLSNEYTLLMTEKDAQKYQHLSGFRYYIIPYTMNLTDACQDFLTEWAHRNLNINYNNEVI